jgi:hypothetical protein
MVTEAARWTPLNNMRGRTEIKEELIKTLGTQEDNQMVLLFLEVLLDIRSLLATFSPPEK